MSKNVKRTRRRKILSERKANGARGFVIQGLDGSAFFRVYGKNKKFIDYDICHLDLEVVIRDSSAAFYKLEGGRYVLDYNSKVLGRNTK